MLAEDGFPAHFSKAIWSFHALLLLRHCLSLLPSSICHSLPPIFASLSSIHPWTIPHRASRHRQRSLSSATASLIFSIQFSLPFIFPLHHCFIHLAFIHPPRRHQWSLSSPLLHWDKHEGWKKITSWPVSPLSPTPTLSCFNLEAQLATLHKDGTHSPSMAPSSQCP